MAQPDAIQLTARTPALWIGTSGFSYPEWRGAFYPEKMPPKQFLGFYAQHFPTTEINNTFYRFPRAATTEPWAQETPEGFRFTLKLPQRITHSKRLQDVDTEMSWLASGVLPLEAKLGAVLVQLPPTFKKDAGRLDTFLAKHASRFPLALEFRHDSWFDAEIEQVLRTHGAAFAVAQDEESTPAERPRWVTGPFVYMRLRREAYTPSELDEWAAWMRGQAVPVYCYLKHDQRAPELAAALVQALHGVG